MMGSGGSSVDTGWASHSTEQAVMYGTQCCVCKHGAQEVHELLGMGYNDSYPCLPLQKMCVEL